MKNKTQQISDKNKKPAIKIVQLWILRTLINAEAHKEWLHETMLGNDSIAYALGLGDWAEGETAYSKDEFLATLRKMHKNIDVCTSFKLPKILNANLNTLSKILGLNKTERKILAFLIFSITDKSLSATLNELGSLRYSELPAYIAVILNLSEKKIIKALSSGGYLIKTGLIKMCGIRGMTLHFDGHIELFNEAFPQEVMNQIIINPVDLFQGVFTLANKPKLTLKHFNHIQNDIDILISYLKQSIKKQSKGINFLIYGIPGIGKTQLTRVIANVVSAKSFEVCTEDEDGDAVEASKRLMSLKIAQSMLINKNSIIVFDECEDVFGNSLSRLLTNSAASFKKGWINNLLEQNSVPCIWLSNDIGAMDAAYIRRFDIVLEMKSPTVKQRQTILKNICGTHISDQLLVNLSQSEQLSPGVVERAIKVFDCIEKNESTVDKDNVVRGLVNKTLNAQGNAKVVDKKISTISDHYSTEFCNADSKLDSLIQGITNYSNARLCLYGPSGTGKTAFGHWLAKQLDFKIITKKGSDLISPYIGMTEKNIAAAFEQANDEQAVLLFDEVDTFLQDRQGAIRNFEISGVNEMLTNMESFQGLFVATTNLFDQLDKASIRRFDLRVKFDYMTCKQVIKLFKVMTKHLGLSNVSIYEEKLLSSMHFLTPGDFYQLERQARFKAFNHSIDVINQLLIINQEKTGGKKPIGFVHSN